MKVPFVTTTLARLGEHFQGVPVNCLVLLESLKCFYSDVSRRAANGRHVKCAVINHRIENDQLVGDIVDPNVWWGGEGTEYEIDREFTKKLYDIKNYEELVAKYFEYLAVEELKQQLNKKFEQTVLESNITVKHSLHGLTTATVLNV